MEVFQNLVKNLDNICKTKPIKANFKAQTTLKGLKRKLDTGFLRSDICFLFSAASENIEKSFVSPDNYPDEAKIFLDAKPINLL